jgi:hypothetical protein
VLLAALVLFVPAAQIAATGRAPDARVLSPAPILGQQTIIGFPQFPPHRREPRGIFSFAVVILEALVLSALLFALVRMAARRKGTAGGPVVLIAITTIVLLLVGVVGEVFFGLVRSPVRDSREITLLILLLVVVATVGFAAVYQFTSRND